MKEKAIELVDRFSDALGLEALGKPAALICVDEIRKVITLNTKRPFEHDDYWLGVRKEIELL